MPNFPGLSYKGVAFSASPWVAWDGSLDGATAVYGLAFSQLNTVIKLDTNVVLNIYADALFAGFAVVGTISDTTITWGTPVLFSGLGAISNSSVTALSATEALVCFRDTADDNKGKAVVLSVSGTTITVNSIVTFEADNIDAVSVVMLSSSKAVVIYNDIDLFAGKAMVLDVAATVITTNTAFAFTPSNTATNCIIAGISSTQVLAVYTDDDNGAYGTAQVLDISGSTVSGNTSYVFNNDVSSLFRIARISAATMAIIYDNAGDSDYPSAQILSLAGTVVSYGTPVRVINVVADEGYFAIARADSQSAFIFYRNVTTNQGAARIASISGTAITMKTPVVVKASACQSMTTCSLDDNRVIYTFRDQGNLSKGTGKISKVA